MRQDTKAVQSCFRLLQTAISDNFQTETYHFTPPYENDLLKIHHGTQKIIPLDWSNKYESIKPSSEFPERRFFILQNNLGFYTIIACLDFEDDPELYTVGPFFSEDTTIDLSSELIARLNLPSRVSTELKDYCNRLPRVSMTSIIRMTMHIVAAFFPEFEQFSPIYVDYKYEKNELLFDNLVQSDRSVKLAEMYRDCFFYFTDALQKGNIEIAHDMLTNLMKEAKLLSSQDLMENRKFLTMLNGFCYDKMLATNVHPAYVIKLLSSCQSKIDKLSAHESVVSIANDICRKYCHLAKNYSYPEYSKTVCSIINYIHLHLDEELTLAFFAKHFNKSASFLSATFSKEVGISITNYIHEARINEAIRYFNTTKMSVSEVSLAVGFQDFAYFSRLFRKQVGCSPRDYCKKIR